MENIVFEKQTVGSRLKGYLRENLLTQKWLACECKVTEQHMCEVLSERVNMSRALCKKISVALGVPERWVLNGDGEELMGLVRADMALEQMCLSVLAGRQYPC